MPPALISNDVEFRCVFQGSGVAPCGPSNHLSIVLGPVGATDEQCVALLKPCLCWPAWHQAPSVCPGHQ